MKRIIILSLIIIFMLSACSQPKMNLDSFAQCLTDKGAVMYGAFWCSHCTNLKKDFGPSFKYINYVECDPRGENEQSELCLEKNIEGFDTWIFNDDSRIVVADLESLSQKTGCIIND